MDMTVLCGMRTSEHTLLLVWAGSCSILILPKPVTLQASAGISSEMFRRTSRKSHATRVSKSACAMSADLQRST